MTKLTIASCAAVFAIACGDAANTAPQDPIVGITAQVGPGSKTLALQLGDSGRVLARALLADSTTADLKAPASFTTRDSSVAVVHPNGIIVARALGVTRIIASSQIGPTRFTDSVVVAVGQSWLLDRR
jgi:hypothetical protein